MKKYFFILFLSLILSGCSGNTLSKKFVEYDPSILIALDTKKDNYVGNFGQNFVNKFQIKKTPKEHFEDVCNSVHDAKKLNIATNVCLTPVLPARLAVLCKTFVAIFNITSTRAG